MLMKKGIRILAIDDSSFEKKDKDALVVGVVGRKDEIEGVLSFRVKTDGNDSTKKIIEKVRKSHFWNQIKLIAIHGTTLAGLNIVDIMQVGRVLGIPVVGVLRKKPKSKDLIDAIRTSKVKNYRKKIELLQKMNKKIKITKLDNFYIQNVGIGKKDFAVFQADCNRFLRLAHIIANGISRGESKGRF